MVAAGHSVAAEPTGPEGGVGGNAHMSSLLPGRCRQRIVRSTELTGRRNDRSSYFRLIPGWLRPSPTTQRVTEPRLWRWKRLPQGSVRRRTSSRSSPADSASCCSSTSSSASSSSTLWCLPALVGDVAVIGAVALALRRRHGRSRSGLSSVRRRASPCRSPCTSPPRLTRAADDGLRGVAGLRRTRRARPAHRVERPFGVTQRRDHCDIGVRIVMLAIVEWRNKGTYSEVLCWRWAGLGGRRRRRLVPAGARHPPASSRLSRSATRNAWRSPASCTMSSPIT